MHVAPLKLQNTSVLLHSNEPTMAFMAHMTGVSPYFTVYFIPPIFHHILGNHISPYFSIFK